MPRPPNCLGRQTGSHLTLDPSFASGCPFQRKAIHFCLIFLITFLGNKKSWHYLLTRLWTIDLMSWSQLAYESFLAVQTSNPIVIQSMPTILVWKSSRQSQITRRTNQTRTLGWLIGLGLADWSRCQIWLLHVAFPKSLLGNMPTNVYIIHNLTLPLG